MRRLIFLAISLQIVCSHCPHMMGFKPEVKSGPSAPGQLPEGDKGWDYDEGAPGSLPEEHFIQTTIVHRSNSESEKKFASELISVMKQVQEQLKKSARVTVDNENIECAQPSDHYRCADFPSQGSYHFLVVEDSSRGAAVYSVDKKYNEKVDGSVEMAILDALSRHSPNSLMVFASKTAEKVVGFVRTLSNKELTAMSRPAGDVTTEKFSPLELALLEPSLLELRHGEGLDTTSNKLVKFESQSEFDAALRKNQHLFVLFWSNVHARSLHTLNQWAETSNIWSGEPAVLSHVECHKHAEFCQGLQSKDFHTIVAYRDGENVGSTQLSGDKNYYMQWMRLIIGGPVVELKTQDHFNNAKKGLTLNAFKSTGWLFVPCGHNRSFHRRVVHRIQTFSIGAEKLVGRYAVAYFLKKDATPTISTYRNQEKKRRSDYEGRFDPASIMAFVTRSSLPSIIDISAGFTTDVLFRQRRSILSLFAPPKFDAFEKLAGRDDLKKAYLFTSVKLDGYPAVSDVLDRLYVEKREEPRIVLFNKDKVYHLELLDTNSADEIYQWIQATESMEPDLELSIKDVHPLRMLQVAQVNDIFGKQNTVILPDHTLFRDSPPAHHPTEFKAGGGGGCPFMAGGGASHDEL